MTSDSLPKSNLSPAPYRGATVRTAGPGLSSAGCKVLGPSGRTNQMQCTVIPFFFKNAFKWYSKAKSVISYTYMESSGFSDVSIK